MNYRLTMLLLSVLPAVPAVADTSVTLGADFWSYSIDGSVRYQSNDPADDIDVNRDLGYNDGNLGSYYLQLEHPLPVLPNVRLARTDINDSAAGHLNRPVNFGGQSYLLGEDVTSSVQFEQTDVVLYYRLLNLAASLDLGLDARYIDSKVRLVGNSGTETATATGWVPMLYAHAGFDLPLTGFALDADGSVTGYQGSRLYEFNLRASYTSPHHVGVEAGYRRLGMKLDDFDSTWADVSFDGPYAGLFLRF
jgi:outer membrane protein